MDYCVLLIALFLWPFADMIGQSTALDEFIDCVELQYGPDDLLINGRPYQPANFRAEGHPYFQTEDWQPGTVYLYGEPYAAHKLKYNLARQQLIIQYDRPNGTYQRVVVSPLLADSFRIGARRFVSQRLILPGQEESGYLEKIYEAELAFYRYQKKVLSAPSNSKPFGQYRGLKDVFYLSVDGQIHKVAKRRDFLACFPNHQSRIKKYMKQHTRRWKKITTPQFIQLLKFCHAQL